MKYVAITQPTNGDAEVVHFLSAEAESEAKVEAQAIAARRGEAVLFGKIIGGVAP